MRTYAIRHIPTGAFMPSRMFRSRGGGWSNWIPQTPAPDGWRGCDGFDKNPRVFFTKRSVQNALTAWLMGVHRRETWSGHDWEGIPDSSDEHVIVDGPLPRLREEMEIVEFDLMEVTT